VRLDGADRAGADRVGVLLGGVLLVGAEPERGAWRIAGAADRGAVCRTDGPDVRGSLLVGAVARGAREVGWRTAGAVVRGAVRGLTLADGWRTAVLILRSRSLAERVFVARRVGAVTVLARLLTACVLSRSRNRIVGCGSVDRLLLTDARLVVVRLVVVRFVVTRSLLRLELTVFRR
jgi:hypothetical protein